MNNTQTNKTRSLAGYGAAMLALFVAPITAIHAAPVLGTPQNSVSASAAGGSGTLGYTDLCGGPTVSGSGVVSYSCAVGTGSPNPAYSASAGGSAGWGVVRVGTTAFGQSIGTNSSGSNADASASAVDYFAISGPANTAGILHGSFVISGAVNAGVTGAPESVTAAMSSYSVQTSLAGINGGSSGSVIKATNGTDIQSGNVTGPGVSLVDAPINFGADGWAVLSMSVYAQLNSNGAAKAYLQCSSCTLFPGEFLTSADFENTIYWGGISSITVNDAPLTNYQLISASGADYRYATAPVPVPAAVWLFGSGMLGLIGVARRKART